MPEHGTAEYGTPVEQWNAKEQQNMEHWWNSRKPQNSGRTMEHPQNSNRTPTEHPRTVKPYKTKNNFSTF